MVDDQANQNKKTNICIEQTGVESDSKRLTV